MVAVEHERARCEFTGRKFSETSFPESAGNSRYKLRKDWLLAHRNVLFFGTGVSGELIIPVLRDFTARKQRIDYSDRQIS